MNRDLNQAYGGTTMQGENSRVRRYTDDSGVSFGDTSALVDHMNGLSINQRKNLAPRDANVHSCVTIDNLNSWPAVERKPARW